MAGALDVTDGAAQAGHVSATAFARAECGMTPAHASDLLTAARGLRRLPATAHALAAGEISFDHALIIARATADVGDAATAAQAETILSDAASAGITAVQLRQLGEEIAYRAGPDAADERERRRFERRYLSFGLTIDGTGVISGACGDAASFEIIRTAADAFAPPAGAADHRTAAQRRLDGLAAACKTALDTGRAPAKHGAAPHISILVRDTTLARAAGAPPARTGHGTMLTARQVLSLCCGAEITAIRWDDGLPLDVGRAARTEPAGLRKALHARDRTCRWPGCDTPAAWCTGHHIGGWATGARTSLTDLVLLCWAHHMHFIHQRGWSITGDPNGALLFRHPSHALTLRSPLPGRSKPRAP
jgi:5-methylcytosine-specific restriction protein A